VKKIIFLTALAASSFSGVAMAGVCASQTDYAVTVSGTPAGTATFATTTIPSPVQAGFYGAQSTCGYAMDWTSPVAKAAEAGAEASCDIAQSSFGQGSCDGGSQAQTTSSFSAPLYSTAGCQGFDSSGTVQKVSFVLSAGGPKCGMNGLATYSLYPYMIQGITFS
jgi:hypothetical protein